MNAPEFPDTCHDDSGRRSVAANWPTPADNPNVDPFPTNARRHPDTRPAADNRTVPEIVFASKLLTNPFTGTGAGHSTGTGTTGHADTITNRARKLQSAPYHPCNFE